MRARNLKPGFFKNEKLGAADPLIGILFQGLWGMADREGRLEDRPLRICAEVFPYRRAVTEKRVHVWLTWLDTESFITRYEVDGRRYIQVLAFWKHQTPHSKEKPSEIPPLSTIRHQPELALGTDLGGPQEQTKVRPVPGKGSARHALTPDSGILNPESGLPISANASAGNERKPIRAVPNFEPIKAAYPSFTAGQDWLNAEHHWRRLIDDDEATETELLEAVIRFAAYVQAGGVSGPGFVMTPGKFFGNREKFWSQPWIPPSSKNETRQDETIAAGLEFLKSSGGAK